MTYSEQKSMLNFIEKYNSMDRKVITENLFHIKAKHKFKRSDIVIDLDVAENRVQGWLNRRNTAVPTVHDALRLATAYQFDISELVDSEMFGHYANDRADNRADDRKECVKW